MICTLLAEKLGDAARMAVASKHLCHPGSCKADCTVGPVLFAELVGNSRIWVCGGV